MAACRVSFTDYSGIEHGVEVSADSLFEAAALAIVEFRKSGFAETAMGPATLLKVCLTPAAPRQYSLTVGRLENWAKNGTCPGPRQKVYRDRIAEMLGITSD